ncbi:MAG: DUF4340 domain-containing protein, partial [Candidatus Hydrogenedentes bacterium]|nr:DUF4340 domain-containing protein [Candidatus Hydrogenedentota bacterium]
MKPRTTLLLLGTLALLCLAYWLTMVNEERVARNVEMAKRLFDFKPEDVSSITITREGEKATSGERREAGGWTVTAPYPVPANPVVWDRVATNLANLSNERTIETDAEDLEPYGLKEPILSVAAQTKEGKSVSVSFGKMEPTQKFRYGKLEDGPLFLAMTDQFFELDRDLLWLRDRDLIKKEQEGITRIEYARMARADDAAEGATGPASWKESVSVVAERGSDGVWHILEPEPAVADQEVLNNLASEIQFAVGRDYVDAPENLSDYTLDPPLARVRVRAGSQEKLQSFFLGSFSTAKEDEGGVFVMREGLPAVFVVDAQMVTLLPKDPNAWHEKRVITRQGSDITGLEYTAGEQHFKLETVEGKGWQVVEPADIESDQTAISQFISELLSLKGANYWPEPQPEFGLDKPVISIRLTYKDVAEPASILVGAATPDGKSRYVTQDTGDVITLATEQVKKLEITTTDLAAKGLLACKQEEVQEVA